MLLFLDTTPEKLQLAERIAKEQKMISYSGNNPNAEKYYLQLEERIQLPIEQWLANLMDASLVVTDSFHGCVFSILFNKPFLAIGNKIRGLDRFISLLSQYDLERNLITNYNKKIQTLNFNFDWEAINRKLEIQMNKSVLFLNSSFH